MNKDKEYLAAINKLKKLDHLINYEIEEKTITIWHLGSYYNENDYDLKLFEENFGISEEEYELIADDCSREKSGLEHKCIVANTTENVTSLTGFIKDLYYYQCKAKPSHINEQLNYQLDDYSEEELETFLNYLKKDGATEMPVIHLRSREWFLTSDDIAFIIDNDIIKTSITEAMGTEEHNQSVFQDYVTSNDIEYYIEIRKDLVSLIEKKLEEM